MKKDPSAPRKKLSLNFGDQDNIPTQLQEKLQKIKDLYDKSQAETISETPKNVKEKIIAPLSKEQEKQAKAIQHEKAQQALKKEAKQLRFEKIKQAVDWLCTQYPLCFSKENPKPLKRHIGKDILGNELQTDLPFSRLNIREAIAYYVKSPKYLEVLSTATHRYDLQGQQVEEVMPEHQQLAAEQLDAFLERRQQLKTKKKEKQMAWNKKKNTASSE